MNFNLNLADINIKDNNNSTSKQKNTARHNSVLIANNNKCAIKALRRTSLQFQT